MWVKRRYSREYENERTNGGPEINKHKAGRELCEITSRKTVLRRVQHLSLELDLQYAHKKPVEA